MSLWILRSSSAFLQCRTDPWLYFCCVHTICDYSDSCYDCIKSLIAMMDSYQEFSLFMVNKEVNAQTSHVMEVIATYHHLQCQRSWTPEPHAMKGFRREPISRLEGLRKERDAREVFGGFHEVGMGGILRREGQWWHQFEKYLWALRAHYIDVSIWGQYFTLNV